MLKQVQNLQIINNFIKFKLIAQKNEYNDKYIRCLIRGIKNNKVINSGTFYQQFKVLSNPIYLDIISLIFKI